MGALHEFGRGYVELSDDGIARVRFHPGVRIDLNDVRRSQDIVVQAPGRYGVLIDSRGITGLTRDARREAHGPRIASHVHGVAMVLDGPVTAAILRLALRLDPPSYPLRTFWRELDALRWLQERMSGRSASERP